MLPPVTTRDRKLLMRRVQELGATEHAEIYRILCDSGVEHMQNSNGVFVNLSRVNDEVVHRIRAFVDFCHDNKRHLDAYDKRMCECKQSQEYQRMLLAAADAPPPPPPLPPAPAPAPAVPSAPALAAGRFTVAKKRWVKRFGASAGPADAPSSGCWGAELCREPPVLAA